MSNVSSSQNLRKIDIIGLDLDQKVKMLEMIAQNLLDLQIEFATIAGRFAELRATIEVQKQVKSALQSAIKAEGSLH